MNSYRADLEIRREQQTRTRRLIIAGSIAAVVLIAAVTASLVWRGLFHDMPALPPTAELWVVDREPSIEVRASDGSLIATRGPLYGRSVAADDLPDHLVMAFLAAEDHRFYSHSGVDLQALARAAWVNSRAGETRQGGSTLTQQLVKNLVLTPDQTLRRKAQEIRLSMALERRLTKREILNLYLNRVYLGERAYGVEAAAQRYFGKSARDVNLAESALLAALPKAPSRLSLVENFDAAESRAREVLDRMTEYGFITAEQAAGAASAAPDIAAETAQASALDWGYTLDLVEKHARQLAPENAPDLVVTVTLDPEIQRKAETALDAVLDESGEASRAGQGALFAIDYSGAVRAMVGGRDYAESQFNRAVQARRQPGSAFKPFVYGAALESGLSPATVREDQPLELEGWSPENFGGNYRGRVTLRDAFKRSINTVAVQLGEQVGPKNIAQLGQRFGIQSPLRPHPSLSLGSSEVTLAELTAAYAVFARDGAYIEPWFIQTIANTRGQTLYEHKSTRGREVYDPENAEAMTGMMQEVVVGGTGVRAALGKRPAAGKTGTSQASRDAWFVGYTAQLAAGVWVGNDDDSPMKNVTGGGLPAEIWRRFMEAAHEGLPAENLNAPPPPDRSSYEERLAAFYSELANAFEAQSAPDEG